MTAVSGPDASVSTGVVPGVAASAEAGADAAAGPVTGAERAGAIGEAERAVFGRMAEVMLPGTDTMPSAGRAGVPGPGLDEVLAARPDLIEPLGRALRDLGGSFSLEALAGYLSADEEAYSALTLCVAAAYYLSPEVRDLIGYPGQEARSFDPYEYVAWIDEGLLDPVTERGPIWRRPPDAPDDSDPARADQAGSPAEGGGP